MFYKVFVADFGVVMIVCVETFLFDLVAEFVLLTFDFFFLSEVSLSNLNFRKYDICQCYVSKTSWY